MLNKILDLDNIKRQYRQFADLVGKKPVDVAAQLVQEAKFLPINININELSVARKTYNTQSICDQNTGGGCGCGGGTVKTVSTTCVKQSDKADAERIMNVLVGQAMQQIDGYLREQGVDMAELTRRPGGGSSRQF